MGPSGLTIFEASLDHHTVTEVAGLKDWESTTGWLGLAPDGFPLVSRIVASPEITAVRWGTR
jgi:hypothetical protein